jgi:peptide/nickel transport system substrate-binding protein
VTFWRPRRRALTSSLALGLALGLLVVAALAGSETRAAASVHRSVKEGGALTIGLASFDFIDPALVLDPAASDAASVVAGTWGAEDASCAMLFRYPVTPPPAVRFDLVPEVATGYPALSRDGKTYTFTIRKGFRFSTGEPVTAQSYASAINRVLNPAMRSPGAVYLNDIVGAESMQQGTARTALGVKAVEDDLIIRLTKKVPDFPARTTMPYFCPVQKDLPIAPEGAGAPLPGSGPYYVSEFVRGKRVVLKRNAYYRGARPHHLDQLVFQVGDDPVTNTHKVEAGQVDVDLSAPVATLGELAAKYGVNKAQFFSVRSPAVFYVYMNTERPLFRNNPKLRQAVNFALDRTAMLQAFGGPVGSRTDSYLPPGLPGYLNVHPYPVRHPDLEKARALARGHTRGGKAVYYACDSVLRRCLAMAQLIQAALKQIGIEVEIKQFPVDVYAAKTRTRGEPFDLMDRRLDVAWVDPYQYVNVQLDGRTIQPTGNLNLSYFNSPSFNGLLDRAGSLSGRARYDAYGRLAVAIARDAAPMAAFIDRNTRFFVSSRVGCVRVGAHGLDLAGVCLK